MGHELLQIEVLHPESNQELPADKPFEINVRANTQGQETGSTTFLVRIDSKYLDSRTGRLTKKEPSFGGERISTGETKSFTAKQVEPGTHTLEVVYRAHLDEAPTTTKREFKVSGSRNNRLIFLAGALVLATASGLFLRKRKR